MGPHDCRFAVGDRVRKIGGDYQLEGVIVAAFRKTSGAVRYVVEADVPKGLLHIYSDTNLVYCGSSSQSVEG